MQEPSVDDRPDHGGQIDHRAAFLVEPRCPCQHDLSDGMGNRFASRVDDLRNEIGIAAGQIVDGAGIESGSFGHDRDRSKGKRWQGNPGDVCLVRQLAQQQPQLVPWPKRVIAECGNQQRVGAVESPGEKAQQVERRLIGPVHVFRDQDVRLALAA